MLWSRGIGSDRCEGFATGKEMQFIISVWGDDKSVQLTISWFALEKRLLDRVREKHAANLVRAQVF